ncbi:Phospho-glucosyltransferase EpsE [Lactobacillus equicursoris DSM 19284 = JCM 14600 = CIP 110162]|uniref:Phospho-glucosyltransferase epse n=1 Tax=Lactobacillus equicursoris DSM 19284 = JCM 14600 = CIP 110162 TaxID=1293597 RepID=K0NU79_9LACO|nr:sugar transferase [Lactobacillus equicursoris]KRL00629.1 phospho-glucosyltransferase epse [Lactobacillus equicursoris DSM 19284 = JCM 14600 = CIP 110162]CCK86009.1 Phospho-glucosyltransferase EpsE [Lactobacillus equicursoris DSM 19284 = JCM 14600 = CIP 110162]
MTKEDNEQVQADSQKVKGRPFYHGIKRVFDFVASAIALVLLSPLFLFLAIKIHGEDGGPVFYSQIRIGKNEKPFRIYKFRSMVVNADQLKKKLLTQNEVEGAMFKMHDDPRVTKIGKFIRAHSLDELPQLWNVLKGDMSLIGPRPPLPDEVAEYDDWDKQRLLVKPGCSGLWQATSRNEADFKGMVLLDIEYINKSSLLFDLKLILMTIKVIIHPNGIYEKINKQ